jgi:dTDP-4-amino-4,6-dideoxygalactose transaminase
MIRLIKPYIAFEDVEAEFREIFDSGIFTRGKYVDMFTEKLCAYTGAKHAFAATSATTALSACLAALGIGAGGEVVVSDFSFPASVNVIEDCGARPVFADVSTDTYNMTADELKRKLTDKTKAVMFVCALGDPDGIEEVTAVCRERGLPLIVDGACAIGSKVNGVPVGAIGDLTCFSFHPRKLLTSGEGGAITTNSDLLAEILRVKLFHGCDTSGEKPEFATYGYNYRLSELQCIMIIKQIEALDSIVSRRIDQQKRYREILEPQGFTAQKHGDAVLHNMQSIVFAVSNGTDRDKLIHDLKAKDIETTIGTYCQSACKYYREKYDDVQRNSLWLEQNTITLPCYDGLDIEYVSELVISQIRLGGSL